GLLLYLMGMVFSYKVMFLTIGGLVVAAGIWGLLQDPTHQQVAPQHRKMIFRRRYSLYYFLTFMAGARRQIFIAFSVYLLVKVFHFTVTEITLLFVVNNAINFVLSPAIGRAIVRFGERWILSIEYGGLIGVFLVYAFTGSKLLVIAMYILDHILFNFAIAIRTYFQKIADPADIAPTAGVAFTINHIAAVVIPVVFGLIWLVSPAAVFLAGAGMATVSLFLATLIPSHPDAGKEVDFWFRKPVAQPAE
ncbi:MFS transporter, partial [Roseibium sp.]|uniref:MFS transporter n=1 Tax=Roseibium sp. TaxID=1936156 RepID=UPI003D09C76B